METDTLLTLAAAALRHQPVTISYAGWKGARSQRTVHPYGLVVHSGRWYVTGADSTSGEVRTFRLDRIKSATLSPGRFEVPAGFDPAARVLSGLAEVPYLHEVSVLVQGTAEHLSRVCQRELRVWKRSRSRTDGCACGCGPSGWIGCRRCSPGSTPVCHRVPRSAARSRTGLWPPARKLRRRSIGLAWIQLSATETNTSAYLNAVRWPRGLTPVRIVSGWQSRGPGQQHSPGSYLRDRSLAPATLKTVNSRR